MSHLRIPIAGVWTSLPLSLLSAKIQSQLLIGNVISHMVALGMIFLIF